MSSLLEFHEFLHELVESQQTVSAGHRALFIKLLHAVRFYALVPDQERHRFTHVRTYFHRRRVVGQHSAGYLFVPFFHLIIYSGNHAFVQIFYRLQLQFHITVMPGLVARLHVQEYKVLCLQSLECSLRLSLVVGVSQSCGTGHLDDVQTRIVADAANQVHGRDDAAGVNFRIELHQRLHRRTIAAAPGPDGISLTLTARSAGDVERVLGQQVLWTDDQGIQQVSRVLWRHSAWVRLRVSRFRFHQQRSPFLVGMVMGWGTHDVLVATADYQQMSILDARDKLYTVIAQMFIQIFDEHIAVFRLQITAVVRQDSAVAQRDDVAADGHVVRAHVIADGSSFQRTSALIYLVQVVAHDGGVRHLTARYESLRHRDESPRASFLRHAVHGRSLGILQQRLSAESLYRMVSHPVT